MTETYLDSLGIAFADHRNYLPARVADWGHPKAVVDIDAKNRWRQHWIGRRCWWCGIITQRDYLGENRGELHHLSRPDIPLCLTWICAKCHRLDGCAVTSEALGRLLYLKWYHDRENLSWVHLAIVMGRHLPELEIDR